MIEAKKIFFYTSLVFLLAFGTLMLVFETTQNMSTFPITFSVLAFTFLLSLYTFVLTTYSDPGFLPTLSAIRRAVEDPTKFLQNKPQVDHLNKMYADLCPIDESENITEEYVVYIHDHPPPDRIFYACSTCGLFRVTSTTSHCRDCNKCVTGFDHHCGFLGVCIGVRNRKNFCALLVSVLSLCLTSLAVCFANCWTFVYSLPHGERYVLTLIEWIFISLFSGFVCFEIFFAPWLLGFLLTLRIVVIIGVLGLVTTVVVVSNNHLPVSSGMLGYLAIVYAVFMLINLFAQIQLLREGETIKRMIKRQQTIAAAGSSESPSGPVSRLLSSPLSRTVTGNSIFSSVSRTVTGSSSAGSPGGPRKTPLPTVNEDLSSSEELYSDEENDEQQEDDQSPLIEEGNRKYTSSPKITIEPMTWIEILKFVSLGFVPSSIPSMYFNN